MEKIFSWSPCSGWLCLASQVQDAVQINFFTHKGARSEDVVVQRRSAVSTIAWHPTDVIICVAWSDGLLNVLSPESSAEFTVDEQISSKVLHLLWSADGKCLCVVMEDGKCGTYTFSGKNSMKKSGEYNVGDKPSAACGRVSFVSPTNPPLMNDDQVPLKGLTRMASMEKYGKVNTNSKSWQLNPSAHFSFVLGCEGGGLHLIEQDGTGVKFSQLDFRVEFVAHYHQKDLLIALASDMMLYHLNILPESTIEEKLKVKLNAKAGNTVVVLRENLLLISHQERDLRVWDLETEENGTISLQSAKGFDGEDGILCMDYSKRKGMISAGTLKGKVANWKHRSGESTVENSWRLQNGNQVGEKITSIEWCPMYSALAVNTGAELTILQEENNIVCLRNKIAAIQSGPSSFTLVNVVSSVSQELKLNFEVKGIHVQEKQLVVWSVDTVMTFDVQSSLATIQSSTFSCRAEDIIIHQQTLYCVEGDKINVRTLQGTIRQILSLPEMEGDPMLIHSSRNWLAVATAAGFIRVYSLNSKEARQEYHSKYIVEALDEFHRFSSMKVNISGNRVACTYFATPLKSGDRILVWNAEADLISYFSFTLGMTDQQQYEAEAELASSQGRPVTAAARKMEREQTRFRLPFHEPGFIFWDETDDRFLVCHAQASSQHMVDMEHETQLKLIYAQCLINEEGTVSRLLEERYARTKKTFHGSRTDFEGTMKM
ncbi:hypothetical protein ANCCEY_02327 [Ancylostoma ceylanicum]|uniref:Anaphase-promoting complex subunit 4 WD40 domain-containing protein n=1 Tax=Ancylostoma ceylanicum TaxID=53326 RepID=A0A0D6MCA8_9BILA|nr:hypothetical protein ANCCEY_02327 [Ancylostoma ceylanicum]